MTEYNLDWLKEKGFFEKSIPLKVKEKKVLADENNSLAYVEVSSNEEIEEIKRKLLSQEAQKLRYIWFFFPITGKLKVFRRIGEVKWFYYSAKMRSDYLKSRVDKLNKFSPTNINILFDIRDIVEKFYWQLWEHRILMAKSIKELKEDKNKLLAVQHLIDRLIFFYFLAQLKLVKIKNEEREWILDRRNTKEFFKWICSQLSESDLQKFLNKIFFDVLGQVIETGFVSKEFAVGGERFSIVSPCLNGGLFIEQEIEGILERKIKISGIKELILKVLNNYNWIIGEELPEEEDVVGDLTPEIIGHIYEKFVVSLEQIGLGKIKLKDVRTVKEELRYGRKKIGAYYTPEEITNYISMNTIYPYIRDKLKEKFSREGKILLDNLFKKDKFNEKELKIIKYLYFEILTKMKICDNACGSGSFLIAAGDILLRLYSKVLKILEDNLNDDRDVKKVLKNIGKSLTRNYYIVRQIIVNNLYGVDIMEGAVEIAKLRFWLWLISQVDPKKIEGKRIETLPNLDFNLMVGNSLIGFVDIEDVDIPIEIGRKTKRARWISLRERCYPLTEFSKEGKIDRVSWLKRFAEQKQKFKTLPAHEAVKLKKKLNKELEKAREFLNKKFYNMLKAKGIKISEEEFLNLKPFHWGFEFYEVFDLEKPKKERGFDVIIGNPPYGNILSDLEKGIIKACYPFKVLVTDNIGKGSKNSAGIFIERSYLILKWKGKFGYIVPHRITRTEEFEKLRRMLLTQTYLYEIIDSSNPFVGVTLEMIELFFSKETNMKNYKVTTKTRRFTSIDKPIIIGRTYSKIFLEFNMFLIYYDEIFQYCKDSSLFNLISATQGVPRRADYSNKEGILCIGAENIRRYSIQLKYKKPRKVSVKFIRKKKLKYQIMNKLLLTQNFSSNLFVCIKPKGFLPDGTSVIIQPLNNNINKNFLLLLLNSRFMKFFLNRYLQNYGGLTNNISSFVTKRLPIKLPPTQKPFIILADYMLFLNATEERRTKEKELIEFIDRKIIDSLVYELYFKEKFKQDGIKTNLLELVEPHLKDISNLNSDEQKLQTIKKVIGKIKNDRKIMEQIGKIKSHPWVKVIEGKENE